MNSRDALLSQLTTFTEEEKYYLRCFELKQAAELRSGSETDSEESGLLRMERLPRFRPFKLHSHTSFEIFYIMSGTCWNQLDDRRYNLHPGLASQPSKVYPSFVGSAGAVTAVP